MTALYRNFESLDETPAPALLYSSRRVTMLDHFRVPYEIDPRLSDGELEQLQSSAGGPALLWAGDVVASPVAIVIAGADGQTPIPLFTGVLADEEVESQLLARGGTWRRARQLTAADGRVIGSIWREDGGSVCLPFDPNDVIESFWSERYLGTAARSRPNLRRGLMLAYYRARPALSRSVQIWLRRRYARVQAQSTFPRWPVETCLHDFFELMFAVLCGITGGPVPHIAPWPDGHAWAIALTHDVEQAEGLAAMDRVMELERAHDVRSSWNFVPKRYRVPLAKVAELVNDGFEVGVHGVYHDGRDFESLARWQQRLPELHDAADRWDAVGFRSAALHRDAEWMRQLRLDYDSSWPDTDPFEPQNGGCCTWLPFFNGEVVELPLTMAQDHTLFVILQRDDETLWIEKAEFLRDAGGLATLDTHPDYLTDDRIFGAYTRFLDHFDGDPTAWRALPCEISAWWRRRAASYLEHDGLTWRITGPAADEGRVVFGEGTW